MLRDVAERARARAGVPGMAVALVEGGEVAWSDGFGVSRAEPGRAIRADTVFAAASLSKPPFAHAVLRLCTRGVLDLDAPLRELADVSHELDAGGITARHVLSHTSGLGNWDERDEGTVGFEPGSRWHYSGEGYEYLQAVVERLAGAPLDDLVRGEVFGPLGMTATSYRVAEGHGESLAVNTRVSAAFSLHTTAPDYARLLVDTLSSEVGSTMLVPQVAIDDVLGWGLGWGLAGDVFWQWGDMRDFESVAICSRAVGRGLICLTNGANGLRACVELVEHVLGMRAAYPIRTVLERGW